MEKNVKEMTDSFVEQLKTTSEYIAYKNQLSVIKNFPELMSQINDYREENFMIQNTYEGDELFDKFDEFDKKYQKLLEIPRVFDFLHAETALIKMMQDVNTQIIEGLDFQ